MIAGIEMFLGVDGKQVGMKMTTEVYKDSTQMEVVSGVSFCHS